MLHLRESGEKRVKRSSTHNGLEEERNEALMLWEGNFGRGSGFTCRAEV